MSEHELIGKVQSVDTGNISVKIKNEQLRNSVQINQIVQIRSTKTGEKIIGLISKILRKAISEKIDEDSETDEVIENLIRVNLVGTLLEASGTERNVFKRTLNTVPSIDADCFLLQGESLSEFMNIISSNSDNPLKIGKYTISDGSDSNLDGNKFFQRHAVIVGGTGSGKSWTVANILGAASSLKSINSVVFDLHGEYTPLAGLPNTKLLKIAGPSDNPDEDKTIFLPYWLLSYEEIESLLLDRSDTNAPNQARALFDTIIKLKKQCLDENDSEQKSVLLNFTIDSPLPYNLDKLIEQLDSLDNQQIDTGETYASGPKKGQPKTNQGPLHGKLTRFIQRLKSRQSDKRLNFIFNSDLRLQKYEWLVSLVKNLLDFGNEKGLKIIDFSEVPSDILPVISGLIARLIFSIQQWMKLETRHPVALFCDEAHLYIPAQPRNGMEERGLASFERIAKEGRKYGISLVVISQRPSDVSKTVLSQCGNFIAMRLTNPDDQNVIKRLFPDNLGDFSEMLPILDVGESLIVGDASLLPTRVKIDRPKVAPDSSTVEFWDEWSKEKTENGIEQAVEALRKQQKM